MFSTKTGLSLFPKNWLMARDFCIKFQNGSENSAGAPAALNEDKKGPANCDLKGEHYEKSIELSGKCKCA
jgi:hypothetical protein